MMPSTSPIKVGLLGRGITASASPATTFVRTAVTFCSTLTGVTSTPACSSSVRAADPQGTSSAQRTKETPGATRSAGSEIPAGLPSGTMSTKRLGEPVQKRWCVATLESHLIAQWLQVWAK